MKRSNPSITNKSNKNRFWQRRNSSHELSPPTELVGALELFTKTLALSSTVAASIALSYGIGFFNELGTASFTFFTFQEHIIFVIKNLPHGVAIACIAYVNFHFLKKFRNALIASSTQEWYKLVPFAYIIAIALFLLLTHKYKSFILGWLGHYGHFDVLSRRYFELVQSATLQPLLHIIVFFSISSYFIAGIIRNERHSENRQIYIFIVSSYMIALVSGYYYGVTKAATYRSGKPLGISQTLITSESVKIMPVVAVISGEKGVLLYQINEKTFIFLKWQYIKEIITNE